MRIAFATVYDIRDVGRGSGTYYHLCLELERQGHSVYGLGPLKVVSPVWTRLARYITRRVLKKPYFSLRDPFFARQIGKEVERKLKDVDYDLLLTNDYGIAGYTHTETPIFLWTDDIFPRRYENNIHPWVEGLTKLSVFYYQHVIRRGLEAAAHCIFPAQSTVDEVVQHYFINPEKVSLIPFGANFKQSSAQEHAPRSFRTVLDKGQLDVLFVGKDWQLKGGAVAAETVRLLNARGINAVLHIVGCTPVVDLPAQQVRIYGVLDKDDPNEYAQLLRLYEQADVFLMPSKAEGFGIAYIEAASFGVPSLAYRTQGVETAVRNGKSGVLLEPEQGAAAFADVIASWYEHPTAYEKLSTGALVYVREEANWEQAIRVFINLVQT